MLGTGKPMFVDPATNGGQLQLTGLKPSELAFSLDPTAAGDSQNLTKLIQYSTELYSKLEAETGLATGWKQ